MTESSTGLDRQDIALLELLQDNADLPIAELAERIHLSKTACWHRLRRLRESGVIRKNVTLLDPNRVGLSLTVYITVKTNQHNQKWFSGFRELVEGIPEVLEVCRTSGDIDYLIKAVVPDIAGYDRLYKKLIKAELTDVSASFVMELLKQTTALPLR